ncbi:ATP-sensitive inward rectifier potassium channel 10, partial [Chroococcidiopsidales cyanobacterium LEGE 13417]|nr:ATP-sensitive inward rectifier potassium channel 10 [Chroococcidiopsidales cyanobacterium LEGE 13417]
MTKAKRRLPRKPIIPIVRQNGRLNVQGINKWYYYWRDPYHLLITMPWSWFLGIVASGYILLNSLFALAYLLQPGSIANARPGNFWDAFFFSIQTMATIGYGVMNPQTDYANVLVAIESWVGLLGVAMGTGIAFARFSRPTARVVFSRVAVVTAYDGIPTLMFRVANKRRNQIIEAQIRVVLVRDEMNAEGQFMRRLYDLPLVRANNPIFILSWTVMHPIDEYSPFYGATLADLEAAETMLVVTLTGIDETVSQMIHARHT